MFYYKKIILDSLPTKPNLEALPIKILYIEDEPITASVQKTILSRNGYEVTHVNSGEKALEIMTSGERFALVLSDIDLGKGLDGPETARQILAKHDLPIVFMSSHAEKEVVDKVESITNYGYVIKNSGEFILTQTLKGALKLFTANNKILTSEIQFRSLFQNLGSIAALYEVILDKNNLPCDYRYLEVNLAFEKTAAIKAADIIGKTQLEVYPGIDTFWLEKFKEVALTGISASSENFVQEFNKYMEIVIYVPQKGQLALIGLDLAERKLAEAARQESEEKFRQLVENSHDIIYTLAPTGVFDFVSPAWTELLGHSINQITGRSFQPFIHPDDRARCIAWFQSVLKTGQRQAGIEYRIKHADGSWRWHCSSAVPLYDKAGRVVGYEGVATDITERKLAEEALQTTNELLSQFMLHSPIYAYIKEVTPTHSIVLQASNNYQEMIGIPGNKMLGKTMAELFPPELAAKMTADDWAVVSSGEILILDEEFNDRSYTTIKAPIPHGSKWLLVGYTIDITERKQLGKAIIEKERLSAIGELAAGVAHDFNNSLQAMFGNIELALLEKDIPPKILEYLATIKTSAADAAVRVQQLQRFARQERSNHEHTLADLNLLLAEAIEQAKPKWKTEAEKKGLKITIKAAYGEKALVDGNLGELRSVFYNLIKNAIEALPNGGSLVFETGQEAASVYVRVTDNGLGMDEETAKRIFQPFFTTKGLELGRGLGLSSVYAIIKEHHGEIYVKKSSPNQGTTIEVLLPYGVKKITPVTQTASEKNTGPLSVLWVDDEDMIREVGQKQLEKLGYQAHLAASGAEALKLLETNKYDLIITDVGMPGMSGWQLAKQIKNLYKTSMVAVVTGWGDETTDEEKERYGVAHVIGKPISFDKIRTLLETAGKKKDPA